MPTTLSEITLHEGLADRPTVVRAADIADRQQGALVAALIADSGISEVKLRDAIARHTSVELLRAETADPDAVRYLSRDLCTKLKCFPVAVEYEGSIRLLVLAMADPTNAIGISEIEHVSGCIVIPKLALLSEVETLTQTHYSAVVTQLMNHRMRHRAPSKPTQETRPKTAPHYRIDQGASAETKFRVLLQLLVDKGVITEADYLAAFRRELGAEPDSSP